MDKKKPLHEAEAGKVSRLNEIRLQYNGNALVNQRSRFLLALNEFPISTQEARRYLDIMHPGGRVMELRRCDWNIVTIRVTENSECGKPHSVARYVLKGRSDE